MFSSMLIFYHLFKCNSASSFMSKQIFVIYVNILRILWVRMILCDMCLSYTFADSTLQCSQMKQEIIFNDNTLQEQHLYNEVATFIFKKEYMLPLLGKVQGHFKVKRSKFDKNCKIP